MVRQDSSGNSTITYQDDFKEHFLVDLHKLLVPFLNISCLLAHIVVIFVGSSRVVLVVGAPLDDFHKDSFIDLRFVSKLSQMSESKGKLTFWTGIASAVAASPRSSKRFLITIERSMTCRSISHVSHFDLEFATRTAQPTNWDNLLIRRLKSDRLRGGCRSRHFDLLFWFFDFDDRRKRTRQNVSILKLNRMSCSRSVWRNSRGRVSWSRRQACKTCRTCWRAAWKRRIKTQIKTW